VMYSFGPGIEVAGWTVGEAAGVPVDDAALQALKPISAITSKKAKAFFVFTSAPLQIEW